MNKKITLAEALKLAMNFHQQKRFAEAEKIYREILLKLPEHADCNHNLGILIHQTGREKEAISYVKRAIKADPNNENYHKTLKFLKKYSKQLKKDNNLNEKNLQVLFQRGNLKDAMLKANEIIKQKPLSAFAYKVRGNIHGILRNYEDAIKDLEEALKLNPKYVDVYNSLGNIYSEKKDLLKAEEIYKKGIDVHPNYVDIYNNLGQLYFEMGDLKNAELNYKKALELNEGFAQAHNNLGQLQYETGNFSDAGKSYLNAIKFLPNFSVAHHNLGKLKLEEGDLESAKSNYLKAIDFDKHNAELYFNILDSLEKVGTANDLKTIVDKAVINIPAKFPVQYGSALVEIGKENYKDSLSLLEQIPINQLKSRSLIKYNYLKAEVLDKVERYEEAFTTFSLANKIVTDAIAGQKVKKTDYFDFISDMSNFMKNNLNTKNHIENEQSIKPVFLIGFPRSGTTLLDTILRTHSEIEVLEEKALIDKLIKTIEASHGKNIGNITLDSIEEISSLRQIYFDSLKEYLDLSDTTKVVIDKFPLNSVKASLIKKLFPEAKFIFALRHPCDSVLSCFMQDFALNSAMMNFLDLEDSAKLYDQVLSHWKESEELLQIPAHYIKYENLVDNLQDTTTNLLKFLELEWDDTLLNFTETAKNREKIATPSYNQVTKTLYKSSINRWKNYTQELESILPILQKWINEFNYSIKH